MATVSLFDKAKTKKVAEVKNDSKKTNVEIVDPQFYADLVRLAEVNEKIDTLGGEAAILHEEIKNRGKEEFKTLYNKNKANPESFNITAKQKDKPDASFMLIPVDNYIKIKSQAHADYLSETISANLVEEDTTYTFNKEILEQYGQAISKLIENSKLPEHVKENLIESTTTWKIKKGTINNFKTDKDLKKFDLDTLVEEIQPIFQVKYVKVKK